MYLGKEVKIKLIGQAKESYLKLKRRTDKESITILNSIDRLKEILRNNPQYGDPIAKRLIPKEYKNIKNLYRAELSNYWRMVYTIEGNEVEIFLFILNIGNHKNYDKLFGYK